MVIIARLMKVIQLNHLPVLYPNNKTNVHSTSLFTARKELPGEAN